MSRLPSKAIKFLSRLQILKMSSTTVTAKNTKSSSKKASATTDNSALLERFNALAAEMETLRKSLPAVLGIKKRRAATSSDGEAEPAARSAWQEWAATCAKRFSADYATHLAVLDKKADVMGFAAKCRAKTHVAEWTEHETAWDAAHPKPVKEAKPKRTKGSKATSAEVEMIASADEAVILSLPRATSPPPGSRKDKKAAAVVVPTKEGSPPSSEDEASTSSKKKSKKPVADSSNSSSSSSSSNSSSSSSSAPAKKLSAKEEKAAAKRALTEAATAAAAADPPIPWTYRGKSYLKNTANQIWANEDGELGAWVGTFDGKKIEKSDGPSA